MKPTSQPLGRNFNEDSKDKDLSPASASIDGAPDASSEANCERDGVPAKPMIPFFYPRAVTKSAYPAYLAVTGRGFVAKDIGFRNSAGAAKHQAVALRSGSDRSAFHRCSFDGFQDTLYAHSNRQFYRDCHIIGTVDFIFGDAAAVFQNCIIAPRQPLPNQANTITAQGRKDPNQITGFSLQGCAIQPHGAVDRPTFLGRPWKNYSTTVVIKSEIGPMVDPTGWMPWVSGTVPPETIDYAEFRNSGAGANVAGRVRWPGYRPAMGEDEARRYAVDSFLNGREWIAEAGVLYDSNL